MSYWRAPERLYDEPDEMLEWAQEALRVAALSKKSAATGKTKRAIVRPGPKSKTAKTTRRTSEKSARS
jgi:DNA transformation protein